MKSLTMNVAILAVLSILIISCSAQRSPFAGRDPIGYPSLLPPTDDPLSNRFGEDDTPTTTIRLPLEAMGDAELVKRMLKLPEDQRPFWLINWQALQENRAKPQTYAQRENGFVDRRS